MLDVAGDGGVDVEARRLVVAEGGGVVLGVLVSEKDLACAESAAEADVFVDVVRAEQTRMLTEWDERRVQCEGAVVELVAFCKPSSTAVFLFV